MKKLLLLDGNSMLFRAYYATMYRHSMQTSNGIPTNAVYGFIMMLQKALDTIQPDALLVAWDADSQTFRKQEYEPYKGTRKPLDDELKVQFPIVREFLDAAGIKRYEIHGYEADDIIGSMAKQCQKSADTTILTSDRDLLQLIDASTKVLLMQKGITEMKLVDNENFPEMYDGLSPIQIIDLKGLMGDTADNIPGVKGVGEKTAIRLLKAHPSVEEVYAHMDEVKGKLKEKLENDKDNAFLSKHLATIYRDMDLPFALESCDFHGFDDTVNDFYAKYEMHSFAQTIKVETKKEVSYKKINSWSIQSSFLLPICSPDPYMSQELYGFIGLQDNIVYYISKADALHDLAFQTNLIDDAYMTWDAKMMMHLLSRNGFKPCLFKEDFHVASFLLHSQATNEDAVLEAMHIHLPESIHDLSKKNKEKNNEERSLAVMSTLILALEQKYKQIWKQLKNEELFDLYETIEKPLIPILFQMEKEGIHIDRKILSDMGVSISEKMDQISTAIYTLAGKEFNINSPKQLATVLYDDLGLKHPGKKRSTSADVLEKIKDQHEIVPKLLEYRKVAKIKSTYIDGLQKHIQMDEKIHTTFNQTMTQTGRLSSSEPNLQNISVRDDQGKEIRKAFTAPKGTFLLSADYSQIELRMLAHMAQEPHMIEAFKEDQDIHTRTATLIFDCKPEEVTPDRRRMAKTVNFGIVYGQTDYGLSQQLNITRVEAREFMNAYFSNYSHIHQYMNGLIDFCKEHGYVETMFHRRRSIPEINDKNFMTREFGKRAAMNAPIQGSAADLIKIAMIKVDQAMKKAHVQSTMLLQIHDELIFEVPEDELEKMKKLVKETMEHALELSVPLKASLAYGPTWYEAK